MDNLIQRLNKISQFISNTVSWLLLAMMLITVTVVILRYVFNIGSIALQESVTYLHGTVFIFAAAYALQSNQHVRVDIFYQNFSAQKKALVNAFGSVFLLMPLCILTTWVSFPYVQRSWSIAEKSNDAGGIPAVFLIKSLILAFAITLFLQALLELTKNILFLLGKIEDPNLHTASEENSLTSGEKV